MKGLSTQILSPKGVPIPSSLMKFIMNVYPISPSIFYTKLPIKSNPLFVCKTHNLFKQPFKIELWYDLKWNHDYITTLQETTLHTILKACSVGNKVGIETIVTKFGWIGKNNSKIHQFVSRINSPIQNRVQDYLVDYIFYINKIAKTKWVNG
jgi:hypothetical protein